MSVLVCVRDSSENRSENAYDEGIMSRENGTFVFCGSNTHYFQHTLISRVLRLDEDSGRTFTLCAATDDEELLQALNRNKTSFVMNELERAPFDILYSDILHFPKGFSRYVGEALRRAEYVHVDDQQQKIEFYRRK
jgi:hypothetical protein